jgi:pimeloyl-ACP methyl ester carboxylesterase
MMALTALTAEESGFCSRLHPAGPTGPLAQETLIYLPGLHGDWTLLGPFRQAMAGRVQLMEITYPRCTDWNLDRYAVAVVEELARLGVASGWILGESFSSQTAWAIARLLGAPNGGALRKAFNMRGLILAGGFVRHPLPWGVRLAGRSSDAVPMWLLRRLCGSYARWARRRCGPAMAEVIGAELDLFVARRSHDGDRRAITSRYGLICNEDLRPIARRECRPVYCLTGGVDPIVPWPPVVRWLRRHCPGYRGRRVVWQAGHNVLLDAPGRAADQILAWMAGAEQGPNAVAAASG